VLDKRATDIHLTAGKRPCLRVNGSLLEHDKAEKLYSVDVENLVNELLSQEQLQKLIKERSLLCSKNLFDLGRFRIHISFQRDSYSINIKCPMGIENLDKFEVDDTVEKLHMLKSGLVLITGPSGSGKSVTASKILQKINKHHCKTIVTIEKSIDYLFKHENSILKQKEVGLDTDSHLMGLKTAMFDDSDVVYVDELTNSDIIELALQAAERGKLIIGCLYTKDAATTIDYLLKSTEGKGTDLRRVQLAESLKAIISHRMVNPNTGDPYPIREILLNSQTIRRIIIEDKVSHIHKAMDAHKEMGMITFEKAVEKLMKEGSLDEKGMHYMGKKDQIIQMKDRVV